MNRSAYPLLFVLGASLLLSLPYCPPFDLGSTDKEIFNYTGWAVYRGLVPYRDFFDHKPPLIYLVNFAGIVLGGKWGLWTINTGLALLATGLFYRLNSRYRLTLPWLLPLLFNLMLRDNLVSQGTNMTREYTSFCYLFLVCVLLGKSRYRHFLIGLLTGLILFTQQDQVLAVLPFLAYALLVFDPLPATKRLLLLAAGFTAIALPIIAYFALHHSLAFFWEDAFLFNLKIYTAQAKTIGDHFRTIKHVLDAGNYEIPCLLALILGVTALAGRSKRKRLILAALAGFLLTLAPEFMGGRYKNGSETVDFVYYFLPLSSSACVLLFSVGAFSEDAIPRSRLAMWPYAALLCCSLTYTALQHATHLKRRDEDPVIASPELNYLRQHRPGEGQLYIFGQEDYIGAYAEFRILAPSRWVYQHMWGWYANWDVDGHILHSIGQDLLDHRTEYVLTDAADTTLFRDQAQHTWWMTFMQTYYQPVSLTGSASRLLWQRKTQ